MIINVDINTYMISLISINVIQVLKIDQHFVNVFIVKTLRFSIPKIVLIFCHYFSEVKTCRKSVGMNTKSSTKLFHSVSKDFLGRVKNQVMLQCSAVRMCNPMPSYKVMQL